MFGRPDPSSPNASRASSRISSSVYRSSHHLRSGSVTTTLLRRVWHSGQVGSALLAR
jgi:hypothetical protein